MGTRIWIGIEPTDSGDRELVIDAIEEKEVPYRTTHNGTLIFNGWGAVRPDRVLTGDVLDHVNRAVMAAYNDSGGGTVARYYEIEDGALQEQDSVDMVSSMEQPLLEFFAREYDMDVPL